MNWKFLLLPLLALAGPSPTLAATLTLLSGHSVSVSGEPMPGGPIVQSTQATLPGSAAATEAFADLEYGLLRAASLVPHLGAPSGTPESINGSATADMEFALLYNGSAPLVIAPGQLRFDITALFLAYEYSPYYASQNALQASLRFGVNGIGNGRYSAEVRQNTSVTTYPSGTGLLPVVNNQPATCTGCVVSNGFAASGGTVGLLAPEIVLDDGDVLNVFARLYVQSAGDANTRGNIGQLSLRLDDPVDILGTPLAGSLHWISAVPVPAPAWLLMSAMAGLALPGLRRSGAPRAGRI